MNTLDDLKILQSLPLEVKIMKSKQRIREWYNYWNGDVYIAFSGGKDSTVLKDLVHSIYPDVPVVFCDTGLEMFDVRAHGLTSDYILKPKYDFQTIIKKYGYPIISKQVSHNISIAKNKPDGKLAKRYFSGELTGSRFDMTRYKWLIDAPFKLTDRCCNIMKKDPSHKFAKEFGLHAFVGTLASESQTRYTQWLHNGCNMFDISNPVSAPLSFWNEEDILEYIYKNDLDIAVEYGNILYDGHYYTTGENRTGCLFCGFGITKDTDRFLRLKEYNSKLYDFVINGGKFDDNGMWIPYNGLGYKFVIDWINEHGNMNIKY